MKSRRYEYLKTRSASTIFVGGIPARIAEEEVYRYFAQFGKIYKIRIPQKKTNSKINPGYCYVTFETEQSKNKALSLIDHELNGRRITCRPFSTGSELREELKATQARKLCIKYVPSSMTEHQFFRHFAQLGELESSYIVNQQTVDQNKDLIVRHIGWLVFKSEAVAKKLVAEQQMVLGGEQVRIEGYDKESIITLSAAGSDRRESSRQILHFIKPTSRVYHTLDHTKTLSQEPQVISNQRHHSSNYTFNILTKPSLQLHLPTVKRRAAGPTVMQAEPTVVSKN